MIDPTAITKYDRTDSELEELLLNAITFAGKNARRQAAKMHQLFSSEKQNPFVVIRAWVKSGVLHEKLRSVKIGKYVLLEKAFSALAHSGIDLAHCTVEELEQFPGIGPKTARLFVLHSRPNQRYAVIDTHMLKEMRALKMTQLRTTPSGPKYFALERLLFRHLDQIGIRNYADFDLAIWKKYALAKENSSR